MPDAVAYKILRADELAALEADGRFAGSPADLVDGFIHLSTAAQLAGTLDRHYGQATGLALAAVDVAALGDALRWEPARGGDLFPHLYAPLTLDTLLAFGPLEREADGTVRLPVAG